LVVVVVVSSSSSSSFGNLSILDGTMAISAVEFSQSSSLEELKKTNSQFATLFFDFFMNLPAQGVQCEISAWWPFERREIQRLGTLH
jgi:hypothetical protein